MFRMVSGRRSSCCRRLSLCSTTLSPGSLPLARERDVTSLREFHVKRQEGFVILVCTMLECAASQGDFNNQLVTGLYPDGLPVANDPPVASI